MGKKTSDTSSEFSNTVSLISVFKAFRVHSFQRFRALEVELRELRIRSDRQIAVLALKLKALEPTGRKRRKAKSNDSADDSESIDLSEFL
mgnify:CR=1 FL=1